MSAASKDGQTALRRPIDRGLLIRFLVVGATNTGFGYAAYCFFVYLDAGYAFASFLALLAGLAWSFVTTGKLVFSSRLHGRLPAFLACWAALYVINVGLIHILVRAGVDPYSAGFLALFPIAALGFLLQRNFVFLVPTGNAPD